MLHVFDLTHFAKIAGYLLQTLNFMLSLAVENIRKKERKKESYIMHEFEQNHT